MEANNLELSSDLDAVRALEALSDSAGWQSAYRQMEAGKLVAHNRLWELAFGSVLRERVNLAVEISARTPESYMTIGFVQSPLPIRVNGWQINQHQIFVLDEDVPFECSAPAGADVVTVHVPTDLSTRYMQMDPLPITVFNKAVPASNLEQYVLTNATSSIDHETLHGITTNLLTNLERAKAVSDKYHSAYRWQTIRRAKQYIEEHLHTDIGIAEVSQYAGVSQRTLLRLFQREYAMSPVEYIRMRRLEAVRIHLAKNASIESIGRVAEDFGFSHAGRFAAQFRQQFGYQPSQFRERGPRI